MFDDEAGEADGPVRLVGGETILVHSIMVVGISIRSSREIILIGLDQRSAPSAPISIVLHL